MESVIIEKIKKLHALAQNAGTEDEAALAASRVAELCQKHNLELGAITLEQQETQATEDAVEKGGNFQAHWAYLAHAITKLFDVGYYTTRTNKPVTKNGIVTGAAPYTRIVFYGLKANVQSATITFQYLNASVETMLEGWIAEGNRAKFSELRSFRMGCGKRILEKAEQHAVASRAQLAGNTECMAIVHLGNQLVKAHANKLHLRTSSVGGASKRDAYQSGYAAGGRVDLHGARSSRMLR